MTIPLTVFLNQVNNELQVDTTNELTAVIGYEQIKQAVARYSRDRPDRRTEDVAGDGSKYYILSSSLDYWIDGFSRVVSIQYPAPTVASDEMPIYLDPDNYQDDYWAEAAGAQTRYLYLPVHAPSSGEAMRITYTVPYLWVAGATTTAVNQVAHGFAVDDYAYLDDATWTKTDDDRQATHQVTEVTDEDNFTVGALVTGVPTTDFFAVAKLAASYCCQAIAVRYSSSTDTTINADSTSHTSRAGEFAARAKELLEAYLSHMGLGGDAEGMSLPAGEFVDWDSAPSWPPGRDYIFHGRQTR